METFETEKQTRVYHTYVGLAGLNDCRCHQPMAHSVAHSLHEQNDVSREKEGRRGKGGGGREEGGGRKRKEEGKGGRRREEGEGRKRKGGRRDGGVEGTHCSHGCLSRPQGLKSHAVTMFEVGKLAEVEGWRGGGLERWRDEEV